MLTAVPKGLGLNPGEDMDVCKCIVPLRQGGTLNSRRAASLVWLVEGQDRWEAPDPLGFSPSKLEWNRAKCLSSLHWVDKGVPSFLGNQTLEVSRKIDHLNVTSVLESQCPRSGKLRSAQ
ncbi:uncharacterized protein TNCV_1972461 [Trichonephila clavipes]|nr:uncharacterized protein TNCV_1972461 [Trichonephila clavipes]